jgi:hypothetical protein
LLKREAGEKLVMEEGGVVGEVVEEVAISEDRKKKKT